jgi:AraC family carnitine catabolism transcriptional activator
LLCDAGKTTLSLPQKDAVTPKRDPYSMLTLPLLDPVSKPARSSQARASQPQPAMRREVEARPGSAKPALRPAIKPAVRPAAKPSASTGNAQSAPLLRQNLITGQVEITVVLLPGFPLYDLAALCDTFEAANRQAERKAFTWRLVSIDGAAVLSSLGTPVSVQAKLDLQTQPDNVLLLAGNELAGTDRLQAWLRQAVARHAHVLASGNAVALMAKAGLLSGKSCAAHWSMQDGLQEANPDITISDRLYVAQDRRLTCVGGKALIDFALACTQGALGDATTRKVADGLNHDRLRPGTESQHPSPSGARGIHNRVLLKAMEMIEYNLAEPLSTDDLAAEVGICPRQLQRLFKRQFDVPPAQFAMQRRMQKARQLLHQTEMSITEVGVALGFISLSHFSRCYAKAFGRQPRQDRLRLICD